MSVSLKDAVQVHLTPAAELIETLASILGTLCESNDKRRENKVISKFHAASIPTISIKDYLTRIYQYAECSDTCFVLGLIYIDRMQARPDFYVSSLNIHRLLITSVMLAAKFFDDHYYNNAFYARIGGVAKEEMNSLELEFLFLIGFSLAVTGDEYQQYNQELTAHAISLRQQRYISAAKAHAAITAAISPFAVACAVSEVPSTVAPSPSPVNSSANSMEWDASRSDGPDSPSSSRSGSSISSPTLSQGSSAGAFPVRFSSHCSEVMRATPCHHTCVQDSQARCAATYGPAAVHDTMCHNNDLVIIQSVPGDSDACMASPQNLQAAQVQCLTNVNTNTVAANMPWGAVEPFTFVMIR